MAGSGHLGSMSITLHLQDDTEIQVWTQNDCETLKLGPIGRNVSIFVNTLAQAQALEAAVAELVAKQVQRISTAETIALQADRIAELEKLVAETGKS